MEHTPFGYVIVDGRPKVHEMEAARLTTLYSSYLLGLSRESAAEVARTIRGIPVLNPGINGMMYNKDIFEQAGITELPETWDQMIIFDTPPQNL